MSKTFKSVTDNESELDVRANDCGVFIAFSRAGQIRQASTFAPSDAPALALAVLEAAGYDDKADDMSQAESYAFDAMHKLQQSVDEQELATAEAKVRAELEAEALDYWKAFHKATELASFDDIQWSDLMPETQAKWLAVARRAREMRNEKQVNTND